MKRKNQSVGYHFSVTSEQVKAHRKLGVLEIFEWLEEMNKFLYLIQSPDERALMRTIKGKRKFF